MPIEDETRAYLSQLRAALFDDPDFLAEVIDTYVSEIHEEIRSLHSALEAEDVEATRLHAHSVKGAAVTVGLHDVATAFAAVESAARDHAPLERLHDLVGQAVTTERGKHPLLERAIQLLRRPDDA